MSMRTPLRVACFLRPPRMDLLEVARRSHRQLTGWNVQPCFLPQSIRRLQHSMMVRLTASDAARSFPEKQANCEEGDGPLVPRLGGMPAVA